MRPLKVGTSVWLAMMASLSWLGTRFVIGGDLWRNVPRCTLCSVMGNDAFLRPSVTGNRVAGHGNDAAFVSCHSQLVAFYELVLCCFQTCTKQRDNHVQSSLHHFNSQYCILSTQQYRCRFRGVSSTQSANRPIVPQCTDYSVSLTPSPCYVTT